MNFVNLICCNCIYSNNINVIIKSSRVWKCLLCTMKAIQYSILSIPFGPTSFLSRLNLHPPSICVSVHLTATQSVVLSLWVILVLADPLDRCCTPGLSVSCTAHTYSSHAVRVSTHSQRSGRVHGSPTSVFFPTRTHMQSCQPASFFFSTRVSFCCFASAVHSWFMVGFLRFVVILFHCFHQSATQEKPPRDF